jgi:hypothetical protein
MSRPTLKAAIEWIALNDESGEDVPGKPDAERNVASYISTSLAADLFDVSVERIAARVMAYRRAELAKRHPGTK